MSNGPFVNPTGDLKRVKLFSLPQDRRTVKLADVQRKFVKELDMLESIDPRFLQMNEREMLPIRALLAASGLNLCTAPWASISALV